MDVEVSAPLGAQADEHRQHQHRGHDTDHRAQTDGQAANKAARAVCDQHRVTTRSHILFSTLYYALSTRPDKTYPRKQTRLDAARDQQNCITRRLVAKQPSTNSEE